MPGEHSETMWVYLPLIWSERFIGLTGGSSQSRLPYAMTGVCVLSNWVIALQNNFACTETVCGIKPGDAN